MCHFQEVRIVLTHKCRNGNNKGNWQVNRGVHPEIRHDVNGALSPVGTPKPGRFRLISTSLWDCKWLPIVLMKLAHLAFLGWTRSEPHRIFVRIPEAGLRTSQLFQHPNLYNPKPNRALKLFRGDYGSRMFSTHGPASSSMKCRTCKRPKVCFTKKNFSKNEHDSNKLKSYSDSFSNKNIHLQKQESIMKLFQKRW